MAPKLYGVVESPPLRSVLICAKALGIELELVQVNLMEKEHLKDDFLKKNPQHTIPILEDEDGFIVSDSHVIMGYLVAKYGKDDSLYPKNDYKLRSTIDHRLHFDSSVLFIRGLQLAKPLVFFDIQPKQEQLDALKEAYQFLDQILANSKTDYVAGNNLSIADFCIFSSITSWTIFLPYTDFPNLNAYITRVEKIPCFDENKTGLVMYHDKVGSKLKKNN